MEGLTEAIGTPFCGREKEKLQNFLKEQQLDYDENITYSYILMDQETIVATGSCSDNIIRCVAVSWAYQGKNLLSRILTNLVQHFFEQGITHYFGFTKPENREVFERAGLYPVAESGKVLLLENRKDGLSKYLKKCKEETEKYQSAHCAGKPDSGVGAVIMNCNPFTKGHRFLIEQASSECTWLHVFILADHGQMFDAAERVEMVVRGTKNLENVIVHKASDYMISPVVFPTYFMKEKEHAFEMNCELDIEIFGRRIAPELQIEKRYIGSEPSCKVTGTYNECLKKALPDFGIGVREIERKKAGDQYISASVVRNALEIGSDEILAEMLPETTMELVKEHFYRKAEGQEVSLEEMMQAREERVRIQRKIRLQHDGTLVCFTLNIPGPVKTAEEYRKLFEIGKSRILGKIREQGAKLQYQTWIMKKTGYEFYLAVAEEPQKVKKWMTDLEEADTLGRFLDIDVIKKDGIKITRAEAGREERKCFLCGEKAYICGRNRTHTVKELTDYIKNAVQEV